MKNIVELYFALSNNLADLENEIKELIKKDSDLDDLEYAFFEKIVDLEEHYDEKKDRYYVRDEQHIAYKQNVYYIWQVTQFEDSYYGVIYYPLGKGKFLKISYSI